MFDRGNREEPLKQSVKITLSDGREVSGNVVVPPGHTLTEVLNIASTFVEFEPVGAPRIFIAKSDVRSVLPLTVAPGPSLPPHQGEDVSNPFAVLGVTAEADKQEVDRAFAHLAKIYQPDQYARIGLPPEVCDYLASMVHRINTAYEKVKAAQQ